MTKRRQLLTYHDAVPSNGVQHTTPCSDCPWARTALPGWLAGTTPEEWLADVCGEGIIECHAIVDAQCAGAAIFRGNVCKVPRNPDILVLPPNRETVFSHHGEFIAHHTVTKPPRKTRKGKRK